MDETGVVVQRQAPARRRQVAAARTCESCSGWLAQGSACRNFTWEGCCMLAPGVPVPALPPLACGPGLHPAPPRAAAKHSNLAKHQHCLAAFLSSTAKQPEGRLSNLVSTFLQYLCPFILGCLQWRRYARALVEFVTDYYRSLLGLRGRPALPVMSTAAPGFLRAALPPAAPERPDSFAAVLRDIK